MVPQRPAAPKVHQQVDGAESDREELLFGEFTESIAAVAAYRKVNPYIPFFQRLEKFLAEEFLPAISVQATLGRIIRYNSCWPGLS